MRSRTLEADVTKRFLLILLLATLASAAGAQTVRITDKPTGLSSGTLYVPVVATEPVARLALFINGVQHSAAAGRAMTSQVDVGLYIRRLRMRAVGYDAEGKIVGEDEMVVNDPRPPFRVRLQGPSLWPESGDAELHANVLRPAEVSIAGVDFYIGEEKVATDDAPPYSASVDATKFPGAVYARVVARGTVTSATEQEANDVLFFGDRAHASTEVTVQQIPVSVAGGNAPLRADAITLVDNGAPRTIEGLVAATDLPLHVILLIDYSESMLEELPVVKSAARQFARALLRPQDRLAVVGFNQSTFWLTRVHQRLEQRGAGGGPREADRRDAPLRQRHRDAVRAAEDARPSRAGRAHRRRRSGQPLQARSPRALRPLRRRAGLSCREEQIALALDEARHRAPAGPPPRAHRRGHGRDVLHHPERARACAASTRASPRSCASNTSWSSTPSPKLPTSGAR